MTTAQQQEGFPQPDEIEGYWDWDKIHAPRPLTPLAGDAVVMTMAEGFTKAQLEFGVPLALKCKIVNNYLYASFCPAETSETREQLRARYGGALEHEVPRVGQRWVDEWEPSIIPTLAKDRGTDYSRMSDAQLLAVLEEQVARLVWYWTIHGWINFVLVPSSNLTDFYNAEFSPQDSTEAYQLLQGYRTKSVEAGKGLWRLSRVVKGRPALTKLFQEKEPGELVAALEASQEGRDFLREFRAYLDEFGWRSDGIYEIADVTWREEPSIPLNTIQGYLQLGEDADPERLYEKAVARREELVARGRQKLAGDPARLERFNSLLEASKHSLRVTEDHSYWIDQLGITLFRRFVLAVGQRFVEKGVVEKAEDIFFLYTDEVREALSRGGDRRQVVKQRRAEMEKWAQVIPPVHLGAPTPLIDEPFFIAIVDKMLGFLPSEPSSDPNVITGIAASPGLVQGTAKVVRTLVEASKLQQGDIMVCEMTVPTWTPLFSTVSAIVADSGGILSHCAIVAREYHLPAVVGTLVGTQFIKDGMTLTVDGGKGVVRIDSRP